MSMTKRTYAIPTEVLQQFEQQVGSDQRSRVVTELILKWLDERERDTLQRAIIEGCRDMAEVDREVGAEWQPLEDEVWRACL